MCKVCSCSTFFTKIRTTNQDLQIKLKKNYNSQKCRSVKSVLNGDTWYSHQAFRALNQAIGRCIRHQSDFGAIVLVDDRYNQPNNLKMLSKWVRGNVTKLDTFGASLNALKAFFEELKVNPPNNYAPKPAWNPEVKQALAAAKVSSTQSTSEVTMQLSERISPQGKKQTPSPKSKKLIEDNNSKKISDFFKPSPTKQLQIESSNAAIVAPQLVQWVCKACGNLVLDSSHQHHGAKQQLVKISQNKPYLLKLYNSLYAKEVSSVEVYVLAECPSISCTPPVQPIVPSSLEKLPSNVNVEVGPSVIPLAAPFNVGTMVLSNYSVDDGIAYALVWCSHCAVADSIPIGVKVIAANKENANAIGDFWVFENCIEKQVEEQIQQSSMMPPPVPQPIKQEKKPEEIINANEQPTQLVVQQEVKKEQQPSVEYFTIDDDDFGDLSTQPYVLNKESEIKGKVSPYFAGKQNNPPPVSQQQGFVRASQLLPKSMIPPPRPKAKANLPRQEDEPDAKRRKV